MTIPYLEAGWTLVVLLGLYGFYCRWEAGRSELAAAFRRQERTRTAGGALATEPAYRSRSRWALLGSSVLAGSVLMWTL